MGEFKNMRRRIISVGLVLALLVSPGFAAGVSAAADEAAVALPAVPAGEEVLEAVQTEREQPELTAEPSTDESADLPAALLDEERTEVGSGNCGATGHEEDVEWTLYSDGELVISGSGAMGGYSSDSADVTTAPWGEHYETIRSVSVQGSVTRIGGYAFSGCSFITEIDLQDGITEIGEGAFRNCSSLTSLAIPDSVTRIDDRVFWGCSSLTGIVIPNGVTSIGYVAFAGCSSLTSITIPDSVTSIANQAFMGCSSLASITIPDNVESIGNQAFSDCSSLTSIVLPKSVTSIGRIAFNGCSKLAYVFYLGTEEDWAAINEDAGFVLPRNAELTCISSLEDEQICTIITEDNENGSVLVDYPLCLPKTTVTITAVPKAGCRLIAFYLDGELLVGNTFVADAGKHTVSAAFETPIASGDCGATDKDDVQWFLYEDGELVISGSGNMETWLNDLSVPWEAHRSEIQSVTIEAGVTNIGYNAFNRCSSLTDITIPYGVTSIERWAFYGCGSLTNVTLPGSVTNIDNEVFRGCSSLTSVNIPDGVTSIESSTFKGCRSLTGITIPSSVTTIKAYAFEQCTSLASVNIPDSVTEIGPSAFGYCSNLTDITIGNGVTSIGNGAFADCSSLTEVILGNSVTSIGNTAFQFCSALTSITIPDSVTTIGQGAFRRCVDLTSITLGSGVESLDSFAFADCSKVTSITIPESVTSIEYGTFMNCSSLTSVVIPDSVTRIWGAAFQNCSSLTGITIPGSVTSIGRTAFQNCSALTSVIIPGGVTSIEYGAFDGCDSLTYVFYLGSEADWDGIEIEDDNDPLLHAELICISSLEDEAICVITTVDTEDGSVRVDYPFCVPGTTVTVTPVPNAGRRKPVIYVDDVLLEGNTFVATGDHTVSAKFEVADNFGTCGAPGNEKNVWWSLYDNGELVISGSGDMADYEYIFFMGTSAPWGKYADDILTVTVENGVTNVGAHAFDTCEALTSVTLANSVTEIEPSAFGYCSNLADVDLGNGVTTIRNVAFCECYALKNITIPNSVTTIGAYAFNRSGLTSIVIPDSVTSLGLEAFYGCTALESAVIGDGLTSLERHTFHSCTALTDVTIGSGLTSIGNSAFGNCTALETIVIPENVVSISSDGVFNGSKALEWVLYNGTRAQLAEIENGELLGYIDDNTAAEVVCQWREVSYDANGGSGSMKTTYVENGSAVILPDCGFTAPAGKRFEGWSINGELYAPGDEYVVSDDTVITAVWGEEPVTVLSCELRQDGSFQFRLEAGRFQGSGVLLVMTYAANGKMLEGKIIALSDMAAGYSGTVTPKIDSDGTYKVFLLEGETYKPLIENLSGDTQAANV